MKTVWWSFYSQWDNFWNSPEVQCIGGLLLIAIVLILAFYAWKRVNIHFIRQHREAPHYHPDRETSRSPEQGENKRK